MLLMTAMDVGYGIRVAVQRVNGPTLIVSMNSAFRSKIPRRHQSSCAVEFSKPTNVHTSNGMAVLFISPDLLIDSPAFFILFQFLILFCFQLLSEK
jgi:hypothetical protein